MEYDQKQRSLIDKKFNITFKIYRDFIEVYIDKELVYQIMMNSKGNIKSQKDKNKCSEILQNEGISEQYVERMFNEMDKRIQKILMMKPNIIYNSESDIYNDQNTNLSFRIKKKIVEIYNNNIFITILKLNSKGEIKSQKTIDDAIEDVMMVDKVSQRIYLEQFFKKIDIKLSMDNEKAIEDLEARRNSEPQFVLELRDSPGKSKSLAELGQAMMEKHSIVRTEEGDFFYLDECYKPLSENRYQYLISEDYNLHLADKHAKESLSTISGIEVEEYNKWEFSDYYYYDPIMKQVEKNDKPLITTRKFINNEILTKYDPNVKFFNEKPTLIEKTLREILIPMHDQKQVKMYKDFLYYIGAALYLGNPEKMCVIYQGDGNDGKTTLNKIIKGLFKSACFNPAATELSNDFFLTRADGMNAIIIDEIQKEDLKEVEDVVKVMTGGVEVDIRKMRSDKVHKTLGYGILFVLSNPIPTFTIEESLLNRIDIIKLPNIFKWTNTVEYDPEIHYPINSNIHKEIKKDYDGLRWLANAAIKAVQEYEYLRQPNNITKSILLGDDKLRKWLGEHLEIDDDIYTSNREIRLRIMNDDNFVGYETKNLAQRIGQGLKDLFNTSLKKFSSYPAKYNVKWIDEGDYSGED